MTWTTVPGWVGNKKCFSLAVSWGVETFLYADLSSTEVNSGPNRRFPSNGYPHNLVLDACSPCQVFSQLVLLGEFKRALISLMVSGKASAIKATALFRTGRDFRIWSEEVPLGRLAFSWSSHTSRMRAMQI